MKVFNVVVQLIDPENGQRTDPRKGSREAMSESFSACAQKDDALLRCFVLVLMEEVEKEGEVGFQYSIAPLVTVEQWISLFPFAKEVV